MIKIARKHIRTNQASPSREEMFLGVNEVKNEKSHEEAPKEKNRNRATLGRFLKSLSIQNLKVDTISQRILATPEHC